MATVWSEILIRPGQPLARLILALWFLPGLVLVGICKMTWWTAVILLGLLYSSTREYRHETLAAFRVWLRLEWHEASSSDTQSASALFWHWAGKRDDPRTRAQMREERRQRLIAQATTDLSTLQRERDAHEEVEVRNARQTELLRLPTRP